MDATINWTVAALREILPRGCGVAGRYLEPPPDFLTDEEANRIKDLGDARRSDFLAGRRAAHQALAQIGILNAAVASGPTNEPIWPGGIVGSISHTHGMAVAAVAPTNVLAAVGIDIERTGAVTSDVWPEVLQASELAVVTSHQGATKDQLATAIFCLKEAFYKYQYPHARQWLEFKDVEILIGGNTNPCRIRPRQRITVAGLERAEFSGHYRIGELITVAAVF